MVFPTVSAPLLLLYILLVKKKCQQRSFSGINVLKAVLPCEYALSLLMRLLLKWLKPYESSRIFQTSVLLCWDRSLPGLLAPAALAPLLSEGVDGLARRASPSTPSLKKMTSREAARSPGRSGQRTSNVQVENPG